jgi:Lamin Tail Domain
MIKICKPYAELCLLLAFLLLSSCTTVTEDIPETVVINEFMTSNSSYSEVPIADEYNETDDWIELYNFSEQPVSLKGLFISDDSTMLRRSSLPDTIIQPHGFFLLWADGLPKQGGHHVDFKLSAEEGDEIILSNSSGRIIDRIQFFAYSGNPVARLPNMSYGRAFDGSEQWCLQKIPTPLQPNSGGL